MKILNTDGCQRLMMRNVNFKNALDKKEKLYKLAGHTLYGWMYIILPQVGAKKVK